ncbi:hypothetical protein L1987_16932 [Smallanthus sonchifolius]|uniref:Uncharacterized protein n=1 Tax=Smallanthus sonchifolius TaxID=185202 RepID=A0ACB9IXZ6_9ASTR|nr:hypothetical protein L1987_16932 [Smallanthus sonchifolius]
MISDQTRRQKSREVSSRYLSSTVAPPSPPLGLNHNNHTLSPNPKPKLKQKHKHTGFIRGLWPSSTSKSNNDNQTHGVKRSENSPVLSKQKSCSEIRHSEKHYTPVLGGSSSRRFTGKILFPGRLSSTKSSDEFDSNQVILPGRLSVDENALRRRSSYYQMSSDSFSDNSESSDLSSPLTTGRNSPASYMAPTSSSKRSGIDVSSRYISPSMSMHNSPKNSTLKTTMKRTNSLSSSSPSEWVSSPSRLGSPSFSSSKPPTSSRGKKNLLHMGLDLIKGKKGGSKLPSSPASDTGTNVEHVYRLRLLQNSLVQWWYVNARAQHVHENIAAQSENKLLCGYESVAKMRQSVVQKRLQLHKEKQEINLNLILQSQTKMLEAWGDMERRHILNVSVMKDYLHAVVCMIPLIEGAKVDLESATMAFQQTSHLVATIKSMLSSVSLTADHETMVTLSELAEVVTQEKLLLEECFEHLRVISTLEIQERDLRCSIIAMNSSDEQQRQQEQQTFM